MGLLKYLAVIGVVLVASIGASAAFGGSGNGGPNSQAPTGNAPWLAPEDGIFTCDWIAAHPSAAVHWQVSCSPVAPEAVNQGSPPATGPSPFASGCQFVPGSGYAGPGVYAWSSYEYINQFYFEGYTSSGTAAFVDYYWYLQHVDHSNQVSGHVYGTNTGFQPTLNVPGNNYRWGAYNANNEAQAYEVCYA